MEYVLAFVCLFFGFILQIGCQDLSVRCIPPIQDRYRAVDGGEISASCIGLGNPEPTTSWYSVNNLIESAENTNSVSVEFSYVNSELFFCTARNQQGIERCYLGAYFESFSRLYSIILQFQNTSHAYNLSVNSYENIQCTLNSLSIEFIARESEVLLSLLIVQKRTNTDIIILTNFIHIFYEFMCVASKNSGNFDIYEPYFGNNVYQSGQILFEISSKVSNDSDSEQRFVYLSTSLEYLENNLNISSDIFITSPALTTTPQYPTHVPTVDPIFQTIDSLTNSIDSSLYDEDSIVSLSVQFENIIKQINQTLAQNTNLTVQLIDITEDILKAIQSLYLNQKYDSSSDRIPPLLLQVILSLESFIEKKVMGLQPNSNSLVFKSKTNLLEVSIMNVGTQNNTGATVAPNVTAISNLQSPTATIPYSLLKEITDQHNVSYIYITTITYNINVFFANEARTTRFLSLNFNLNHQSNTFGDVINITFTDNIGYIFGVTNPECVFFANKDSVETTGLKLASYSKDSIVCSTDHTTTFAAIVTFNRTFSGNESIATNIVSFVLVSCSFTALSISLILFCLAGKTFFVNLPNLIYFNYAIALLLGCTCFLFLLPTAVLNEYYCMCAAFVTQFAWTAVFTWSMCITIMLIHFFRGKKLIKVQNIKPFILYCLFGWGIPIFPTIITLIATSPDLKNYINFEYNTTCYLSSGPMKFSTWGLLGTVLIFLLLEIIALIYLTLLICWRMNNGLNNCCKSKDIQPREKSFQLQFRNLYMGFVVIISILGLPWLLFIVNAVCDYIIGDAILTSVMKWLFVVLNAPIGVVYFFAYTIHCKEVKGLFKQNIFTSKDTPSSPVMTSSLSRQSFPLPDSIPRARKRISVSSSLTYPVSPVDNAYENPVFSISQ